MHIAPLPPLLPLLPPGLEGCGLGLRVVSTAVTSDTTIDTPAERGREGSAETYPSRTDGAQDSYYAAPKRRRREKENMYPCTALQRMLDE